MTYQPNRFAPTELTKVDKNGQTEYRNIDYIDSRTGNVYPVLQNNEECQFTIDGRCIVYEVKND
jgi:hypothetical protein